MHQWKPTLGAPLTPRELQLVDLASRGNTSAAIARRLSLSLDTVKTTLSRAYIKLGATDRAHAVRRGFELGLLTADQPAEVAS